MLGTDQKIQSMPGCKSGPPLEAYAGSGGGSRCRVAWARGGVSGLDAVSRSAGSDAYKAIFFRRNRFFHCSQSRARDLKKRLYYQMVISLKVLQFLPNFLQAFVKARPKT